MTNETAKCQEALLAASKVVSLVGRADIGYQLIKIATDPAVLRQLDAIASDARPLAAGE